MAEPIIYVADEQEIFNQFSRKNRLSCAARVENAAVLPSPSLFLILVQLRSIFALEPNVQFRVLKATFAQTSLSKRHVQGGIFVGMEAWNHKTVR